MPFVDITSDLEAKSNPVILSNELHDNDIKNIKKGKNFIICIMLLLRTYNIYFSDE
tara:strand:- start:1550 stop:1717 length:168 start_codon:yes stop_codon:yes gene_type:complete